tara:strand:+ start:360 stop:569 length:210 start_codon:yes stop_codon:yes gene_type:complete
MKAMFDKEGRIINPDFKTIKISSDISIVFHEEKKSFIRIVEGSYSEFNKGVLVTSSELKKILKVDRPSF